MVRISSNGAMRWTNWNTAGDFSSHYNYPIGPVNQSINRGIAASALNGIPQTVSLAVESNNETKPVWLVVSAFELVCAPDAEKPYRFPTPMQLRAQVYYHQQYSL